MIGFTTHFAGANNVNSKNSNVKPIVRGPSFKSVKPKSEG